MELFYLALINEGVMLPLLTSNHIYFSFARVEEDFDIVERKIVDVFEICEFGALAGNCT